MHKIKLKYEHLEESRKKLLSALEALDNYALSFKINENKWSAIQICFHIVKSEQLTMLSLNKNLKSRDNLKQSGINGSLRKMILSFALISRFKFKAPSLLGNMPETYDFSELMKKWSAIRISLGEYVNNFPDDLQNRTIFKHPMAGWFNLNQTMDFLQNHFNHHKVQIEKSIKAYDTFNIKK